MALAIKDIIPWKNLVLQIAVKQKITLTPDAFLFCHRLYNLTFFMKQSFLYQTGMMPPLLNTLWLSESDLKTQMCPG